MIKCRTLRGLYRNIRAGKECCLEYTDIASTHTGYIVYLWYKGTNLIISDTTYNNIKDYLKKRI